MRLAGFEVGSSAPLFLIAGPCVIDSESLCLSIAETLVRLAEELPVQVVFKASFDKANRTSASSFRGDRLQVRPSSPSCAAHRAHTPVTR